MPYKRSNYQNYCVAHEAMVIKRGFWRGYAENQRLGGMKQRPLLKRGKKVKKKEGKKEILVLFIFYTKIAKKKKKKLSSIFGPHAGF